MPKRLTVPSYERKFVVGKWGKVVEWLKLEGERFKAGEPIVIIETEKVTIQVGASEAGTLTEILAPVGAEVTVTNNLALFEAADRQGSKSSRSHKKSIARKGQRETRREKK